jgi:release factor glutamine methyltransferase
MLNTLVGMNGNGSKGALLLPTIEFRWQLDPNTTVGLALVAATRRLKGAGSDTPKLDGEVLLAHVLECSRAQLYAHPERLLTQAERERYEEVVARRYAHEPVAYLVGEKAFYGLDLWVDSRVLIPRPETELLVDLVLDLLAQAERLHARAHGGNGHGTPPPEPDILVADIGTGSGALSLAVAANSLSTRIYAVDISPGALEVARANAARHALTHRVDFLLGDLLYPLPEPVDVIAANLPYVAQDEWSSLAPDIVQFEPSLALSGGADGLDIIRRLIEQAPPKLRPFGVILLEIGASQGEAVAAIANRVFPEAFVEVISDYGYRDRIVRIQT